MNNIHHVLAGYQRHLLDPKGNELPHQLSDITPFQVVSFYESYFFIYCTVLRSGRFSESLTMPMLGVLFNMLFIHYSQVVNEL